MQSNPQTPRADRRRDWRGKSTGIAALLSPALLTPALVLTWVALALYSYRHVMGDLVQQWQSNTSYSHGPAVLPIAIWLLWQRRSTLPAIGKPWPVALGLLLAAHCLLWLGGYFYLPALQRWTIPLYLCGTVGLLAGRRVLIWSLPAVCFLGFMIPLPFQLEMLANQFLQWLSAWSSCYLLSLASTFAVTDGYSLVMASGAVGITKDCSGLRMTVAVAALGYVITFLAPQRPGRGQGGRGQGGRGQGGGTHGWRVGAELGMVMLLVIPAAVLANATRISVIALVVDRYQTSASTAWAHDMGDWLALPIGAVLFLAFRSWIVRVRQIGRATIPGQRSGDREPRGNPPWREFCKPALKVASVPIAMAGIIAVSIVHYAAERDRILSRTLTEARSHEENADWARAAACYREMLSLQPAQIETRYRFAWVSLQAADSLEASMQAFYQLEAVLEQAPDHADALRTHLKMALDLDQAKPASSSAERLYAIDRQDADSLRLCVEAMLRFPQDSRGGHPTITVERFNDWIDRFGPTSVWRDRFVLELASFCCDHRESIDRRVTHVVEPLIAGATNRTGSADAYFQAWRFEHVFGTGTPSIDRARLRIDSGCPAPVAYRIYLAAAREAGLEKRPDDAKRFLKHAIEQLPTDHAAYEILGDVFATQAQWTQSTAAYLRGWRLAGDRPMELGIKLAESLLETDRHAESSHLVGQLVKQENNAFHAVRRDLRVRLMVVQARLDVDANRHQEALKTIRRCQSLITMYERSAGPSAVWLPTLETLKAQCLVRLGRYSDAARLFESRAARSHASADQWTAAARAWRSDGNTPAAERCYRSAIAELGFDTQVWLELVRLLHDRYGIGGAIEEIVLRQRSAGERPILSDKVLAQAWETVGRSELAIRHYRSAAEREVQDVAALAIALARHGDAEEAVALVADQRWLVDASLRAHTAAVIGVSVSELPPALKATLETIIGHGLTQASGDMALLMATVAWYTHCHQTTAAMELLDRAVTLQPGNVIAGNNLAMLLADERRDFRRALEHIDQVLKQTGPVSEFLDTKGWILVQMNRAEDALPWLVRAVESSDAAAPTTHLHLATAYLAVGDRDQARESFRLVQVGQLRVDELNHSEQRAWTRLQNEFSPPNELTKRSPSQRSNDA